MKNLYSLATLIAIAVIALGAASYFGTETAPLYSPEKALERQDDYVSNTDSVTDGLPKKTGGQATPQSDTSVVHEAISYKVDGVRISLPGGWTQIESDYSLDAAKNQYPLDAYNGITVISPDYSTTQVADGPWGIMTDAIATGARISFTSEPENLASHLENAQSYAQFEDNLSAGSGNIIEHGILTVAGIPASFAHFKNVEGTGGGFARIVFYRNERIFNLGIRYGVGSTFSMYRDEFFAASSSLNIEEVTAPRSGIFGSLSYFKPNFVDPAKERFSIGFQYSTQPVCNSREISGEEFTLDVGDGKTYPADCSGTVVHTYGALGIYTARYLHNGEEIARAVITIE